MIYIAGLRGLVGSAILRNLQARGFTNFVLRTHAELDLENQAAVRAFFAALRGMRRVFGRGERHEHTRDHSSAPS